jgi:hypothetical protein
MGKLPTEPAGLGQYGLTDIVENKLSWHKFLKIKKQETKT